MHDAATIARVRNPVFTAVYDAFSDSLNSEDGIFKGKSSTSNMLVYLDSVD